MGDTLTIAAITLAAHVSTNIDNFVILAAYMTDRRYRRMSLAAAFVGTAVVVVGASALVATGASIIPIGLTRYLGLVPFSLGVYHLVNLFRNQENGGMTTKAAAQLMAHSPVSVSAYAAFALVILANSGDTLLLLSSLFADQRPRYDRVAALTVAASAIVMALTASFLMSRPTICALVERISSRVLPFILIGVGLFIFLDTPTDIQ